MKLWCNGCMKIKKGISYRDIESLEDNHECDYLGLKLIDIPLITSYGVLK